MERTEVFEALRTELDAAQIPWREIREGIVLEFADGCDMLLVDDLEIQRNAKQTPKLTAQAIYKRFDKLNRRRKAVIIGVRHWAQRSDVAMQQSSTGDWRTEKACCTSSIDVGNVLTRLVEDRAPYEALIEFLRGNNLFDQVTPEEARRIVTLQKPPAKERPIQDDPEEEWTWTQRGKGSPKTSNKITEENLVWRLREQLPSHEVTTDCCTEKRAIQIDFADGEGFFAVHSSRTYLRKLVAKHGSFNALVDHLVSRFKRFDQGRRQVLHALENILAARGCFKDRIGLDRDDWAYGKTHQEYRFDPGVSLTRTLNRHDPIDVVLEWCQKSDVTPKVTREEIEAALEQPAIRMTTCMLPKVPFADGPQIPSLSDLNIEAVDKSSQEWIAIFRQEANKPVAKQTHFPAAALAYWSEPQWYALGEDTWVDDAWWIEQARAAWQVEVERAKPYIENQQAAYILLAYGIDLPRQRVLERYEGSHYHPEAIDDGLSWVLEGELPWSMLDFDIEYPDQLGKLPPQLARKIAITLRETIRGVEGEWDGFGDAYPDKEWAHLDRESAEQWLTPEEIAWLHTTCRNWASSTSDLTTFWYTSPFGIAVQFGWTDVADQIEKNPSVTTGLLVNTLGFSYLPEYLLWLSRLKPGTFAARWAAYALLLNQEAEVERAVAEFSKSILEVSDKQIRKHQYAMIREVQHSNTKFQRELKLAAAIAWHRCREAGVIG